MRGAPQGMRDVRILITRVDEATSRDTQWNVLDAAPTFRIDCLAPAVNTSEALAEAARLVLEAHDGSDWPDDQLSIQFITVDSVTQEDADTLIGDSSVGSYGHTLTITVFCEPMTS